MTPAAPAPIHALGDLLRRHPRHVVLAGVVSGLTSAGGPAWLVAVAAAAAAAAGGTKGVATIAALGVMAGAAWGHERLERADQSFLSRASGTVLSGRVTVLEPPRKRESGGSSFRARWLEGPARGEMAVVRMPDAPRDTGQAGSPGEIVPGTVLEVTG